MRDAVELVNLIKQVAVNAVKAGKPTEIVFGRVKSASPLQITVDQKMTLGSNQLILTQAVTDYEVSAENGEEKLTLTVKNALAAGDEVILIRMQGGQKYIVLDRIG